MRFINPKVVDAVGAQSCALTKMGRGVFGHAEAIFGLGNELLKTNAAPQAGHCGWWLER